MIKIDKVKEKVKVKVKEKKRNRRKSSKGQIINKKSKKVIVDSRGKGQGLQKRGLKRQYRREFQDKK